MSTVRALLAAGLVAALAGAAAAKPDQAAVNAAVAKAAAYLRAAHQPGGNAVARVVGTGPSSLVGLALLEAGTKPDDPSVQSITTHVRGKAAAETATYSVSLAVLYLDRLGDTRDVGLIQLLGTRLYAGMLTDGGYGYECPDLPGLGAGVLAGTVPPPGPPKPPAGKRNPEKDGFLPVPDRAAAKKGGAAAGRLHPAVAPVNAAVRQLIAANGRLPAGRDNSNTQFGLIGLWVAARHGVPADDAFALLEAGFLVSQGRDGGWPYTAGGPSTTAMTCAGLLGLAVGASRKPEPAKPDAPAAPPSDNPFDDPPKKPGAAPKDGAPRGAAVAAGLTRVGAVLRAGAPDVGLGDLYYTLWSVERVGMAYGLDTIGDVDWFRWGCEFLLPRQQPSGAWTVGNTSVSDEVSTAFAVLFLLRSNFVADLTTRVKGKVKDPGKAVLRGGQGFRPAEPPAEPGPPGLGESRPAEPGDPPPDPDKLAADLVKTAEFPGTLRALRDAKGGEYTQAILKAIPKLPPEKQAQARDALAERLVRMTAKTLKAQLADGDAELRRGAARACGPKGDKAVVSALIDRVTDLSEPVGQAARASLKTLTDQDFGPEPGANAAATAQSLGAWKRWFLASGLGS